MKAHLICFSFMLNISTVAIMSSNCQNCQIMSINCHQECYCFSYSLKYLHRIPSSYIYTSRLIFIRRLLKLRVTGSGAFSQSVRFPYWKCSRGLHLEQNTTTAKLEVTYSKRSAAKSVIKINVKRTKMMADVYNNNLFLDILLRIEWK